MTGNGPPKRKKQHLWKWTQPVLTCSSCGNDCERTSSGQRYCADCRENADTVIRKTRHLRDYGLSYEQYQALLKRQGGACAICMCSLPENIGYRSLDVDHDHQSGQVRGLLCTSCNRAVGLLRDDPVIAEQMVLYLRLSNAVPRRSRVVESIPLRDTHAAR